MNPKPPLYRDYIESNFKDYREYQRRALSQEPEMTKFLKKLLPCWLNTELPYRLLDIGCGNGNTCFHLNSQHPHWYYVGVDVVSGLIEDGRHLFSNIENLRLEVADAHYLESFSEEPFDVVLMWRVLQGLENWKQALRSAYSITKPGGHLIISTLLNDADVDLSIIMRDYSASGDIKDVTLRIFSEAQFRAYCMELGVQTVTFEKFNMPIALPRPERGLNTYTVDLMEGNKIQLAGGALVDHWKIAHIIKGDLTDANN
ncbi:MAG: methyltransferase [Coleofasciculus chthonoplastes F3-SA18-01]|uniref:class I SAM-dependent methyltransferase n=1 Tax=Coleofasciculus chthonoplastes TaxID=64178 RepID=UPI0032FC25F1